MNIEEIIRLLMALCFAQRKDVIMTQFSTFPHTLPDETPDKRLERWRKLSYIMPLEYICKNPHLPWDWQIVTRRNGVIDMYFRYPSIPWHSGEITRVLPLDYMLANPVKDWNQTYMITRGDVTRRVITDNPDFPWEKHTIQVMFGNAGGLTIDDLRTGHFPDWETYSEIFSLDIILANPDLNWEPVIVTYHRDMTIDIYKRMYDDPRLRHLCESHELNPSFSIDEMLEKLVVDFSMLSRRNDVKSRHLIEYPDENWDIPELTPKMPIKFVLETLDKYPWDTGILDISYWLQVYQSKLATQKEIFKCLPSNIPPDIAQLICDKSEPARSIIQLRTDLCRQKCALIMEKYLLRIDMDECKGDHDAAMALETNTHDLLKIDAELVKIYESKSDPITVSGRRAGRSEEEPDEEPQHDGEILRLHVQERGGTPRWPKALSLR